MLCAALSIALGTASLPMETLRPLYHFTAPKGWLNDPNGLVYFGGEYHLFYQHNPLGTEWGNMTWGHAVSKDLLHWKHLPHALEPDASGTMFSGSAVVDHDNTSGLGKAVKPPLVLFYTAAGGTNEVSQGQKFTQGLAFSHDGRTFEKYVSNPVLRHIANENRDPKVVWHAPTKTWIMALYLDGDRFALFNSSDLKSWTKTDEIHVPGSSECPDLFELPVQGTKERKWVFWTANGRYLVGNFDGSKFQGKGPYGSTFGANDYAAQTFSNVPRERVIQISWMRGGSYPGMPFNQQMTIPRELTLIETAEGIRLSFKPVAEISKVRGRELGGESEVAVNSDALEIRGTFSRDRDADLDLGSQSVRYDSKSRTITCMGKSARLPGEQFKVDFTVLVDRTSMELFVDRGLVQMANCYVPESPRTRLGWTGFLELRVFPLKSTLSN